MKTVSIIIPHYNDWSNLRELLLTIPELDNVEVVVVDDNTANNKEPLEIFKKEFPKTKFLINNSGVKGAGASRNVALKEVTGDWLLFADADDKFSPDLSDVIIEYLASDYDIVYFVPDSFVENTEVQSSRHSLYRNLVLNYINDKSLLYELKLRYEFIVPWSKLIRHEVVKKNNVKFEEIMYANDILFSAKASYYANEIKAVSKNIYSVRENEGSLTNDITEERFKLRLDSWVDYNRFLSNNLTKKELHLLNMTGTQQIKYVLSNKLGLNNCLLVIKTCRNHNIPIVDKRLFDPRLMMEFLKNKFN